MIDTPSIPKKREGTWLWLYKIAAGFLIVLLLAVHFLVNHLVAPNGLLNYDEVIQYYQVPIVPVMEIVFLIVVISHALVGMRSIVLDLNPSDLVLKVVDILFFAIGSGFIIYGIWLVLVIIQKA